MPSKPRPIKFVAVVDFSACNTAFKAGDEVPSGPALATVLKYGDRFVTNERKADNKTQPPETQE